MSIIDNIFTPCYTKKNNRKTGKTMEESINIMTYDNWTDIITALIGALATILAAYFAMRGARKIVETVKKTALQAIRKTASMRLM